MRRLVWKIIVCVINQMYKMRWIISKRKKALMDMNYFVCQNTTFIFKSFERQNMAKRLYKNIQSYYPGVRVIIADDSSKPLKLQGENLEVIQLPFNSGLSYGLNRALERVQTPFVIRMDDDELLTPNTKFHEHLQFLMGHPEVDLVGVLACNLLRRKPLAELAEMYFKQPMSNAPKKLLIPHLTKIDEQKIVVGKTPNVFIARTDKIKEIGYDDNIRMIDHNEFFYRAAGNMVSVLDTTSYVLHTHNPFDSHYQKYRSDYQGDLEYIRAKQGRTVSTKYNIKEKFLEAFRAYLLQESINWDSIQNSEGRELFRLATEQDVYPMIYEAVRKCKAMEPYSAQLQGVSEKVMQIVARQVVKTTEFLQLYKKLCKAGIKPFVVKGLVCRNLYPMPNHRPSTDEDIFIRWKDFEICHKVFIEFGMRLVDEQQDIANAHEVIYWKDDSRLHIELHKELFAPDSDTSGEFNSFFESAHERAVQVNIQDVDVSTLGYTDHMLFLICHAFKHFVGSGLGIRPICDIMLFANEYGKHIDWRYILECCKKIHAETFVATVFRIGEKYLTFDKKKANYPLEWDEYAKDEKELLEDVLSGGTLGDKDLNQIHSSNITLNAVKANKKGEKSRNSLSATVFPSLNEMKKNYRYLEKHPYLLPVAWLSRVGKYGKEVRSKKNSNPTESLALGKRRVELLKKYDVLK